MATRAVRRVPEEQGRNNLFDVPFPCEHPGQRRKPKRHRAMSGSGRRSSDGTCSTEAPRKYDTRKPEPSAMCARNRRVTRSTATSSAPKPTRARLLTWPLEGTPTCSRSTSHFRKMPRVAICQSSLSCHEVHARQISSAPRGAMGPGRLAARRNSVSSHTAPPFGRDGSAKLGCPVVRRDHGVLAHALPEQQNGPLVLLRPPAWSWRNPGLVWQAHRVIPGDRRAQQLWQEQFNTSLHNFGVVTCTAHLTLNVQRESEVSISTRVDDGCALGPQPALDRVPSAIETTLARDLAL